MIEAQELHKLYGPMTALQKASFKVHRGEVVGLLGPNGAEIGRASCRERV